MNKRRISLVLYILMGVVAIATFVCYLVMPPWKAFYMACAGGVIIVNLLFSLYLLKRNMRQ